MRCAASSGAGGRLSPLRPHRRYGRRMRATTHVVVPADGPHRPGRADAGQPHHPVHRGRRHRRRRHPGHARGRRRRRREGVRRLPPRPLDGDLRGGEGDPRLRQRRVAARRDARDRARVLGVDQGADDDAGGRRYPLAQRGAASAARPLRLPAARAPLPRRAKPARGPVEDGHGHLPGELRGHLRWHRVGGRLARRAQGHRLPAGRDGGAQDPLPGHVRHRHQAGLARGHRAAGAQGDRVRDRQPAGLGDAGAQGQHHEVHRGRLPRLGLCAGAAGVRRHAARRRPLAVARTRRPRRSRSRT